MAVAALRNLVAKIRIPLSSSLRSSRAPAPFPSPPPPKGDFEKALLVKNKIESAEVKDLFSSGDLIAEQCELVEEMISQVSDRHVQASRAVRGVTFKYFCTGVVLGSIKHMIESFYYNEAEIELPERQIHVE
ncbi:uncharacterized protein LOC124686987 [Lolium rigidum]|uniref:uncharacterized protein LOC124686987 n=1 Tax=Lolium rigidum TaxID=89674 RepID=UPI001F5DDE8B|nr:uncharacterized protein LOC124686987 [Lolium rigidum]